MSVPDSKVHGQKIRVKCPYCEECVIGDVSDGRSTPNIVFKVTRHPEDPFFHYLLYFQASFRGKRIRALNRGHLQYLIDYLSADLRTAEFVITDPVTEMNAGTLSAICDLFSTCLCHSYTFVNPKFTRKDNYIV